jgi:NAD+ kinase
MIIGLHLRKRKESIVQTAEDIAKFLKSKNIQVLVSQEIEDIFPHYSIFSKDNPLKPDCMISLGGDGTFLEASQIALEYNIPIIGINYGHTGFLTNIEEEEIFSSIDEIINKQYRIEERSVLSGSLIRNGEEIETMLALNDFVIQRDPFEKILLIDVFLDRQKISSIRADGIIIASSTGSTAYSLSAGGPILDPLSDHIIINPLCPHKLSDRCIVVTGSKTIYLTITTRSNLTSLVYDGKHHSHLQNLDRLRIKLHTKKLKMIFLKEKNFYDVLNQKFQWGF